ncbi:MAG TPA: hypothetical protein VJN88_08365 [Ktedonobacterales bacterium]|nr:hypothetical protein [Ktedonobacterales bacterium]
MIRQSTPMRWLCALLLLVVIALSVAACGGSTSPSSPGQPTATHHSGY